MSKKDEALKLALEALKKTQDEGYNLPGTAIREAITAIREALAEQPAQPIKQGWDVDTLLNKPKQPAQQEPVAWMWKDGTITSNPDRADGTWTPLYTTPPANANAGKPWVGLTDEDKAAIYRQADEENWHDQPLLEAVEAKLREKNA